MKTSEQNLELTVDHLNIRLKGVPAATARAVVEQLGSELAAQLARQEALVNITPQSSPGTRTLWIEHVNVGAGILGLQKGESSSPPALRRRIAAGIAHTVAANAARAAKKE